LDGAEQGSRVIPVQIIEVPSTSHTAFIRVGSSKGNGSQAAMMLRKREICVDVKIVIHE
jgi:hypothetical protein